jgi:hypothetical protein
MIFLLCLVSFLAGMYVDNRFCPKIRYENGELKVNWSDKNKKP